LVKTNSANNVNLSKGTLCWYHLIIWRHCCNFNF